MISFYPGPSKLHPQVGKFMQDAVKEGILSVNHRSKEFINLSEKAIRLLKKRLSIPSDYTVFYTSSATECWEIIAQSLIIDNSLHLYNGAFGEKWFEYTQRLHPQARRHSFAAAESPDFSNLLISPDTELIAVVQNETSNGTQVTNQALKELREKNPTPLIAVDVTSSLGGIKIDFKNGDIWLASVQKCLGLPAGMGLFICSPKAIQKATAINESNHYNSLTFLAEKMKVWQTSYTPNVLGVYLLQKTLEISPSISQTDKLIRTRAKNWYHFFSGKFKNYELLINNSTIQSQTVITVKGDEQAILKLKAKAKKEGLLLGNGYGAWSKNTFRIANFPSISDKEIRTLQKFLHQQLH